MLSQETNHGSSNMTRNQMTKSAMEKSTFFKVKKGKEMEIENQGDADCVLSFKGIVHFQFLRQDQTID